MDQLTILQHFGALIAKTSIILIRHSRHGHHLGLVEFNDMIHRALYRSQISLFGVMQFVDQNVFEKLCFLF